jgi:hypothetical protein
MSINSERKSMDKFIDRFGITQRRWLAENFKDCLVSLEVQGEPYFKRLGPSVQAVMRDAVQFTCLYKPLKGRVTEEKFNPEDEEEVAKEFVTFQVVLYQPGTHDKITLERKFTRALLESK